jgi:hypothetical protein
MFNILPIIQVKSTIKEHFAMLSKDVNDLIKIFGTDKKIYIIALCMIKEKVAIGLVNSRRLKSILRI